ncbi:MAG: glycosyltransferase family 2 protein, partial [Rhodospirillales bacterium]|nr:glycosyltransferase family 2 protein [Rhodospirillales bacterium]
ARGAGELNIKGLVLIPSYNSGVKLRETVEAARAAWPSVWLVVDGSTDGSADGLMDAPDFGVIRRVHNGGKGEAVLAGLRKAVGAGFTHVLVMDADGQHPAEEIPRFMALAEARPEAMILGVPRFEANAPRIRVWGRGISNIIVRVMSGARIEDALFGFRVYPAAALLRVMEASPGMRGYDFDAEAVVRLVWAGVPVANQPAPVRYFSKQDGGISHFRYGQDNARLARMYARLFAAWAWRRFRPSRH